MMHNKPAPECRRRELHRPEIALLWVGGVAYSHLLSITAKQPNHGHL